jgi:hypothetical protein
MKSLTLPLCLPLKTTNNSEGLLVSRAGIEPATY